MSILVIGVNHRSAPLAVLERVALSSDDVGKAVERLAQRDNVREVVVVSTCNRTEVYAVAEKFHGAYADIRDFLCEAGDIAADELHPHLYSHHDDAAVRHLFDVAAGLDSAVIGETEILGQVRTSWEVAQQSLGARTTMNLLFRRAIGVGKRARTETGIARGTASISHAAVEMAVERLGGLAGRNVAVVGAGAMGEGIAVALARAGAGEVTVINRTPERGAELAHRVGGRAVGLDSLADVLAATDVAITCTGAGEAGRVARARHVGHRASSGSSAADRRHRGAPRRRAGRRDPPGRRSARPRCAGRVGRAWPRAAPHRSRSRAPHRRGRGRALHPRGHVDAGGAARGRAAPSGRADPRVRARATRRSKLAHLDDDSRATVEHLTRALVAKLLHEPSVRLREQAGSPRGERNAAAVADLFDLG